MVQALKEWSGVYSCWESGLAGPDALLLDCIVLVRIPGSPGYTDTELAQAVRRALEWDVLAPHTRIMSTAADGWVTLEGEVNVLQERQDAERYLQGMRGVQNRIAVRPPQVMPGRMHAVFEDALERCTERVAAREAERIQVQRAMAW